MSLVSSSGWAPAWSSSRYCRQLAAIGAAGQEALESSSALIVGLGGLGSAVALYLAAAGVGRLVLIDVDRVERSNLNRQVLYGESDMGSFKVAAAAARLSDLNPEISVEGVVADARSGVLERLLDGVDVVVDCLDDWEDKLRLNEEAVRRGIPLVHAAVEGWQGHVMTIIARKGPCLACTFGSVKGRRCTSVVGAAVGVIGSIQAGEALKLLAGVGEPLVGRLIFVDLKSGTALGAEVARDPRCPVCSRLY
ncbi:MAG: HesA/MoeB/ThiF family protein [Fervidicoccaceae archaeon]